MGLDYLYFKECSLERERERERNTAYSARVQKKDGPTSASLATSLRFLRILSIPSLGGPPEKRTADQAANKAGLHRSLTGHTEPQESVCLMEVWAAFLFIYFLNIKQ